MGEKKEQKIVVCLTLTSSDKQLILNGIQLTGIFKKELCLFYNYTRKEKKNYAQIKQQINELSAPITREIPGLRVSTLLISEKNGEWPDKLSDDYEAILFLACSNKFSKYSLSLAESPVPFLFVNSTDGEVPPYKNVILPVDRRKENSDTGLWSSYFGRYNSSEIVVVAANENNSVNQKHVSKNVLLIKKLYQKFGINHKFYKGTKSGTANITESLTLAKNSDCDLLIMLGNSSRAPWDLGTGYGIKKIIQNAGNIPLLVVNPRRDNYLLCD